MAKYTKQQLQEVKSTMKEMLKEETSLNFTEKQGIKNILNGINRLKPMLEQLTQTGEFDDKQSAQTLWLGVIENLTKYKFLVQ